jgi:hypothetical protein
MRFSSGAARRGLLVISLAFILTAMLFTGARAQTYGPKLLIQEEVECNYWPNGTEKSGLSRTGQFKMSVPNNDDVLQYIRVTLDSGYDTNTNIDNDTVYQDVLVSYPSDDDWELLYVNTTSNDADTSYTIDNNVANIAPTINLSMEYRNVRGGYHLYDEANIDDPDNDIYINFTLTNPSSSRSLSGVTSYIYFERDVSGSNDIQIISEDEYGVGTATASSGDGDGHDDMITWTGISIGTSSHVNLTVHLNITSGVHIGSLDEIDLDEGTKGPTADEGINVTHSGTGTLFSAITASDKFTRGPIRQGVDLAATGGSWYARGFIRNMGNAVGSGYNLTYNVSEWRVYEIQSSGVPFDDANQTGYFNQNPGVTDLVVPGDGRIYTTNGTRSSNTSMYNTTSGTKPYIAVYFEWEVVWNSSNSENNLTYINTTMDLPTLYLVDLTLDKSVAGTASPEVGGENITINETLINVGANETEPHFVQLLSYVPSNTTGDDWRGSGWDIDNAVPVYLNGTYRLNVTDNSNCMMTVTDPTETADGLVNLTIYDLPNCEFWGTSNAVGHTFDENDNLTISFVITSNDQMTTGDTYEFWSIGQLNSSSETMDREYNTENKSVVIAGKRITGYKDLIGYSPTIPTLINTTINLTIEDTVGSGISGIKFMDYVPINTISYSDFVGNFSNGDAVLIRNGTVMTYGVDYDITDNGTTLLPDGLWVQIFEFVNATGNSTWNLSNGEYIEVSYQVNFTSAGTYVLPAMISAFDPDTGISLATAFYGIIKVIIPEPNVPLSIDEGELKQSETVLVGKPTVWTKGFDVYNPNPRQVSARFETVVFDDSTDGYVSYFDENGKRIEEVVAFSRDSQGRKLMYWESNKLNAFETRNYEVAVLTPPVLEIDRDVEVLEQLPEKKVRLKMDVYLKSFAQENYENVILNLPVAYRKVEEVRDGFGNRLPFTGGAETTGITVDRVSAGQLKTITVVYVESYPTIIITPDRDRYNLNSPVSLEILVINGGERIEYPYLEVEIYTPGMDVIFTDIERLSEMEPLEKTEMYEKFVVPASAPAGMYVASARFREDFAVLASATGNFYVMGISGGIPEALEIIMIVLVSLVLIYFSFRRLREVRGSRKPQAYGGI